jgi:hypothetical protein
MFLDVHVINLCYMEEKEMIQLVKAHGTSHLQVISHNNLESVAGKALESLVGLLGIM